MSQKFSHLCSILEHTDPADPALVLFLVGVRTKRKVFITPVAGWVHSLGRGSSCSSLWWIASGGGSCGEALMQVLELVICIGGKLVEFMGQAVDIVRMSADVSGG